MVAAAGTDRAPLSALPIQQPPEHLIHRPRPINHRHIPRTLATRTPTLPTFPPSLIFFKAPRTARISPTTTRTGRRNPIVLVTTVLAFLADRHTKQGREAGQQQGSKPLTRTLSLPKTSTPTNQSPNQVTDHHSTKPRHHPAVPQIREQRRLQHARLRFPISVHPAVPADVRAVRPHFSILVSFMVG
jgi:hypothetical protein